MVGQSLIPINCAKREPCSGALFTIFVLMTELLLIMKNVGWSSKSPSIILNQSIILMQFCNPTWHTFFGTLCALLLWPTGLPSRGSFLYTIFCSLRQNYTYRLEWWTSYFFSPPGQISSLPGWKILLASRRTKLERVLISAHLPVAADAVINKSCKHYGLKAPHILDWPRSGLPSFATAGLSRSGLPSPATTTSNDDQNGRDLVHPLSLLLDCQDLV